MKIIIFIGILFSLVAFAAPNIVTEGKEEQSDSEIIEKSILWKAPIDQSSWAPIELKKMIQDTSRFKPFGNFYEVLDETEAFGGKVLYVGLIGVNYAGGPNVVIESTHHDLAKYIKEKYQYELTFVEENGDEGYWTDLGKNLRLVIIPHPSIKGASIIIGEYTGL
jgi:hypothetical protein